MVALARQYGGPPLSLADIAAAETISLSYLEQLVAALRRAGLVTSVRGASGGYQLARPPSGITIGDVVRPLESIALTSCAEPDGNRDCCKRRPDCATRDFWRGVNAGLLASLDNTTLADLCPAGRDRLEASQFGPDPTAATSVAPA
jgi:Rrf2 family protein